MSEHLLTKFLCQACRRRHKLISTGHWNTSLIVRTSDKGSSIIKPPNCHVGSFVRVRS
uniref:Uncharacterized protein n=1 Tax=Arundo donax TaxID=35708 RepID=A0A0A9GCR8_ARUDO